MASKRTALILALMATPTIATSAFAQSSIEDLDSAGDEKKKKSRNRATTTAETEVIREIERGAYLKAAMGSTSYLLNYRGTLRAGTTMALAFGQDFLDEERRSMAWEVAFQTGLHNGRIWEAQPGTSPYYIQGDTRTFLGSAAYEFSLYPSRRIGIGIRLGGGVGYAPLLIHPQPWQEEVLPSSGVDPGVHNSILPFGFGGPTFEYYTKLSHFSVGLDTDVFYAVGFDLGASITGTLKYTF